MERRTAAASTRRAPRTSCRAASSSGCSSGGCRRWCARAYEQVPLFRRRMEERGSRPDDVRALDDIAQLPFTVKTDLRDTYPFGLFASPMEEIVRLHASSGTTGKPIVVAYTQEDLEVWTSVMVRTFAACGLHKGDVVQNAYGYGLFTGGLGAHYGAEALGATVIPISGGNTERQIMVMKDFGVTAICCTPSYFLHLIERRQGGEDRLRAAAAGGRLRRRALDRGDAPAHRGGEPASRPTTSTASPRSSARASGIECAVPGRPAHLRGPLLPGDHRPEDRRAAARRRGGRAGAHHAPQAGHADDPLPHARHHRHRPGAVRLRPHHPPHPPHRPPHRRHVHHPRRERLPVADRDGAAGRSRGRCRTTRSSSPARRGWTRWRCRSR